MMSSTPPLPSEAPIPDDPLASSALPLPMSASVMLSALPMDAHTALSAVDDMAGLKVKIRFMPLPNAPALTKKIFQVSASNRFETVVSFLRKRLGVKAEQSVVCYVNSVFAPGLDEGVGALWRCFKTNFQGDEQLVVAYSLTPAFG